MSMLWPQLPTTVAEQHYIAVTERTDDRPEPQHRAQVYTPTGGRWASETDVRSLIDTMTLLARQHGYPNPAATEQRIAFDRAAAQLLHRELDLTWSEGGQRGIWSFLALIALPHLTRWRFGIANDERWIASDLTRHTWARLWWQAVVFESDPALLFSLSESDLNQLLERRSLGEDPRLVCSLSRAVIARTPNSSDRRPLIRDVTARLRRRLAFLTPTALDTAALDALCRVETEDSLEALAERADRGE